MTTPISKPSLAVSAIPWVVVRLGGRSRQGGSGGGAPLAGAGSAGEV